MISGIPDSLAETLETRGVELIREHAKFVGANEVEAGGRRIAAKHIVIATGSKPRPMPSKRCAKRASASGSRCIPASA
jgi:glutathione reductase (NADPH)